MSAVIDRPNRVSHGAGSPRWRGLKTWQVALAIAFLIGGFSLLFRLEEAKSLGSHEGYAIVPAREMLLTGDYIVPRFGEMPRLKKPPLIYWSILTSATLTGGLDIASARLPAALAALLLAGLMARWALRWYGGVAAVGAAAAQFTSVYVLVFGRKAEADMILVLLIAGALYLVVEQRTDESRRQSFARWAGIWTLAAISWMGKFHFGPAMIFAPAIAWLVLERRWRFLLGMINPVGLLVFVAAVGIWPALVLQRLPEAWTIWHEETIGRAVGALGRQPVWYYLPHLVTWTLPWTVFAVLAWPASWKRAFPNLSVKVRPTWPNLRALLKTWQRVVSDGDSRERFLWVWLVATFAIVTASANKHPHYILPALPAFSLWTGRRLAELADKARRGERLLSLPWAVGLSVCGVAGLAAPFLISLRHLDGLAPLTVFGVVSVTTAGLVSAGWLLWFRLNRYATAVCACTWIVAYGAAAIWIIPSADHRIGAYRFVEAIRAKYGDQTDVGIYAMDQDAAAWYLGEPLFRVETLDQIVQRLRSTPEMLLVTESQRQAELANVGTVKLVKEFSDIPGLPKVELGHYRRMVLVRLNARVEQAGLDPAAPLDRNRR